MKKLFNLFTLLSLFLFFSCAQLIESTTVRIKLPSTGENSRSIALSYNIEDVAEYKIEFKGEEYSDTFIRKPGEEIILTDIPTGAYTVTGYANDKNGKCIGYGVVLATVIPGQDNEVEVVIKKNIIGNIAGAEPERTIETINIVEGDEFDFEELLEDISLNVFFKSGYVEKLQLKELLETKYFFPVYSFSSTVNGKSISEQYDYNTDKLTLTLMSYDCSSEDFMKVLEDQEGLEDILKKQIKVFDLEYKLNVESKTFIMKYYSDEYTNVSGTKTYKTNGESIIKLFVPEKENFTFTGWYYLDGEKKEGPLTEIQSNKIDSYTRGEFRATWKVSKLGINPSDYPTKQYPNGVMFTLDEYFGNENIKEAIDSIDLLLIAFDSVTGSTDVKIAIASGNECIKFSNDGKYIVDFNDETKIYYDISEHVYNKFKLKFYYDYATKTFFEQEYDLLSAYSLPTITRSGYKFIRWTYQNKKEEDLVQDEEYIHREFPADELVEINSEELKKYENGFFIAEWELTNISEVSADDFKNCEYENSLYIYLYEDFGSNSTDMSYLVNFIKKLAEYNIDVSIDMYSCNLITSLEYEYSGVNKTDVFKDCNNLIYINLPSRINNIPASCFENSGLEAIDLPDNILEIKSKAFANCDQLEHFYLPGTVTNIEDDAFEDTPVITDFMFDPYSENYIYIYGNAILKKDKSQVIDFNPDEKTANQISLKLYYNEDLNNCETETIDKRLVLELSYYGLSNNRSGFSPMGWYYFSDDETVKVGEDTVNPETYNTYINDGVLTLKAKYAVDVLHYTSIEWSKYTNAEYPNGLTLNLYSDTAITGDDIGFFCTAVSSFKEECTDLKININMSECSDIIFPDAAFEGKTNIVSIILPPTQTSIPMQFLKETGIKKLVLPDTVRIIDQDAFAWCNDLKYVDIGKAAITNTGGRYSDCFRYTFNIEEFAVSENNTHHILSEDKQMVLSKTGLEVYVDGFQQAGATRKIPEGVRVIGGYMYYGTRVSKVIFPESLMAIENDVFTLSRDLTVNIPARVYQIRKNVLSGIIGSNVNVTFDGIDGWYKTDIVNQTPRPSQLTNGDLLSNASESFTYYCRNFISKNKVGDGTDDGLATEISANANSLYNIIFSFMHSSWDTTSSSLSDSDFAALKTAFESFASSCTFVLDLYDATNTELMDSWLFCIDNVHFSTIILPHGLEKINENALYECRIDKIKIPASVKSIGENALYSSYPRTIEIENLDGWYDQYGNPVDADDVMEKISYGDAIHKN